jgi:hypothetical protein
MFNLASAAPAAATLPLFLPQAPPDKVSGLIHAATLLAQLLGQGRAIDSRALRSAMETAFCGTDAAGAWVWKDAYEALEAAQIMFLRKFGTAMRTRASFRVRDARHADTPRRTPAGADPPLGGIRASAAILDADHARLCCRRAAALTSADFVLEPSAGTGLLAIFAELAKARLALNEMADTALDCSGACSGASRSAAIMPSGSTTGWTRRSGRVWC